MSQAGVLKSPAADAVSRVVQSVVVAIAHWRVVASPTAAHVIGASESVAR